MKRRILLVDDNPADLELVRIGFRERSANVELITAANGIDALEILRAIAEGEAEPLDLVILDVNMPGLSGHETLEFARRDALVDETPVVMFSTSAVSRDESRAVALGATAYFVKPDRFERLLDVLGDMESLAATRSLPRAHEQAS